MYGQGLVKGLGITLKHQFGKKITEQYPEEMPNLAKRYRGSLCFEAEKCIACGLCVKCCPNNALSLETYKDINNKKKLASYTIDLQYCMFCNMCVEVCPQSCLYFDHNFELSKYDRNEIKRVHKGVIKNEELSVTNNNADNTGDKIDGEKRHKQIIALYNAIQKKPENIMKKLLEEEEQIQIMCEIVQKDEEKAKKIAELMVENIDKAQKVAVALVNKAQKELKKIESEGGDENDHK